MSAAGNRGPYKGLASFEDSDADARIFFGRDRARRIIVANLLASRLTVLYGESGVGKSSVLRAGVARDLRALPEALAVVVFTDWRDDPARALEARIAEETGAEPQGRIAETLELGAALIGGEVFVILDGLEEESLYHGPEVGPGSFLDEFSEAATRTDIRASFLLAVREDSLAKLDRFKSRVPDVFGNYLRLERLDRAAGREAILGPVDRYNESAGNGQVDVEPALVDTVLDQVAAGRVELGVAGQGGHGNGSAGGIEAPFLQLVMARLWAAETEQHSSVLRLETLKRLGGAQQIVRDHLEQALESLDDSQQDVAAAVFNHLVTPSGAKIAHDASDLAGYVGTPPLRLEPVLALLAAQRILMPVPGVTGSDYPRYEIYHDTLADPIIAWRTKHESERRVARVSDAAARRHRRLLVIAVAAVLLAGAMTGVTIFAFSQRSEAQRQAEIAKRETKIAALNEDKFRKEAKAATSNYHKAVAATKKAAANADKAEKATGLAKRRLTRARIAEKHAMYEKRIAEANAAAYKTASATSSAETQKADANYATAQHETQVAQKQAAVALAEKRKAQRATNEARANLASASAAKTQADRNARKATARALAATALADLTTAPERALADALKSAELDSAGSENVLRSALLYSRVRTILPLSSAATTAAATSGSVPTARGFRTTAVSTGQSVLAVGDLTELRLYKLPAGQLLRTLKVGAKVAAVAFSQDGKLVATASPTGYVDVWDVATGRRLQHLSHGGRPVRSVTFSHNGKLLATASNDKQVRIWNVSTGQLTLRPIAHPRAVSLVEFSPDDRLLLTVDGMNARLIDVATGQIVQTMTQEDPIRTATFSPDGQLLATGGTGTHATAQLWAVADGKTVGSVLRGHGGDILSVSFSPDGKRLVTASEDNTARVWSVPDGIPVATLVAHANEVLTASFSPDSEWIVTASKDNTARIWEAATGFPKFLLAGDHKPLTTAFFTADARWVISASEDGSARIWDPGTNPELRQLGEHTAAVDKVSVSPDGRFALSAGIDGTVRLWPLVGGGQSRTLQLGGQVTAASFSPDGKLIIAANDAGIARVWRTLDGHVVRTLEHGAPIRAAAFSFDGSRIVTAGADGDAKVWKTAGGPLLETLKHGGIVTAASFSPDGAFVATAGDDGVARLWATDSGQLVRVLRGHTKAIVALAFSPNGNWLATASADWTARIWDVSPRGTASVRAVLVGHSDALTSLAFSPDSMRLVTASLDHDAIVWRVPDGTRLKTLSGHNGVVSDVAFSSDGRWIVTAGPTTAGLWQANASSGSPPLLYLHGSGAQLESVAFSPKAWRVVTGSKDGTVATYDCQLCGGVPQLIALAKARLGSLGQNLTPAQRHQYLGS
jgi:WD40 repeat protein